MIYPWLVLAKNRSRWQRKQVEFLILSMPELVSLSLKYPCPDVEAAPKHRVAEGHTHHRDDQNQLPRESKQRLMIKTFLIKCLTIHSYLTIAPKATKEERSRTMPTTIEASFSEREEPEYLKIALQ